MVGDILTFFIQMLEILEMASQGLLLRSKGTEFSSEET